MTEPLRMNDRQMKDARALIRNVCANYDKSLNGCLLLDEGSAPGCPQMITYSVLCRYFQNVLLEDKAGKPLKNEITHPLPLLSPRMPTCAVCCQTFTANSNRAKYCEKCAATIRRKQAVERKRRSRLAAS